MQATTLGSYLLYRPDRTFLAAQADGSVAPDAEPSPAADWRVAEAAPKAVHALAGFGARALSRRRPGRRLAFSALDGFRFAPAERLRRLPRGGAERARHAGEGRDLVRRGRRLPRGPHALDDLRLPRRQLPLRAALAPLRDPVRAAGLQRDRGPAGHRRAAPELPQLRQPGAAARHHRLAEADRVAARQPHLRGDLLALGRARLAGRAAADGDVDQREPRALRAPGEPAQLVRRDDDRAPGLQGHPRARSATSTRRPAAPARGSSRSSPTRTRRGA